MAKSADYFISGVWYTKLNNSKQISHVMIHIVSENDSFGKGMKTIEADVIRYIKAGKIIFTITWNYPSWKKGALVTYETVFGKEYLRTVKDATIKDNLDNSFPMSDILG